MADNDAGREIRLWPAVILVLLQWFATFGTGMIAPATPLQFFGMMGGPLVGLVLLWIWWLFASRAPKGNKVLAVVLPIIAFALAFVLAHPSAKMAVYIYGLPFFCLLFVAWVALTRSWADGPRRLALIAMVLISAGVWILVRTDGVDGDMAAEFAPRWEPTAEEKLLASGVDEDPTPPVVEEDSQNTPSPVDDPTSVDMLGPADGAGDEEDADSDTVSAEPDATVADGIQSADEPALSQGSVGDPDGADSAAGIIDMAGAAQATMATDTSPRADGVAWPGLRGSGRDGVVRGLEIATDWQASPPELLWKRPVGPGWSSVAVAGDVLFTQEQRGDDEIVAAYNASTGEPVWVHRDGVRFWEPLAGAGPRATPTLSGEVLYTFGATGILNALSAANGSVVWSRNAAEDTSAPTPDWGFSSSPLVTDGLVVVHTGAADGKAVAAYDALTGEPRWTAPAGALSYSSLHMTSLQGVRQMLISTGDGMTSLAPADGTVLWTHSWPVPGGARIVQPAMTEDGAVLVGTGFGMGVRRLGVSKDGSEWKVEEDWTDAGMKPYYNDLVIHGEHVYGFDGRILACLDLTTGERAWKGGRYGNGQLLLLADQDLLLILSDRGEVALVKADPGGFEELAKIEAISGKTWNHPAIADGVLYVRNAEEMAAYRLPPAP